LAPSPRRIQEGKLRFGVERGDIAKKLPSFNKSAVNRSRSHGDDIPAQVLAKGRRAGYAATARLRVATASSGVANSRDRIAEHLTRRLRNYAGNPCAMPIYVRRLISGDPQPLPMSPPTHHEGSRPATKQ
jgi:hypothetical protein